MTGAIYEATAEAFANMEATITRLTQERDEARERWRMNGILHKQEQARADAVEADIARLNLERLNAEARAQDAEARVRALVAASTDETEARHDLRARIAELEGALREACDIIADHLPAYDVWLDKADALLTPTAPAREGEAKLCHFPSCLCPGAAECEVERYDGPTGRGEVGRG